MTKLRGTLNNPSPVGSLGQGMVIRPKLVNSNDPNFLFHSPMCVLFHSLQNVCVLFHSLLTKVI